MAYKQGSSGGNTYAYTATATSYSVLTTDVIVGVTDTTAARTITMPNTGMATGQTWTIKDESLACSINNITVSGNGANILSTASASTVIINTNGGAIDIYWNGTAFGVK